MRARVLAALLVFAAIAVLSFAVPLAFTASDARTRDLMLSRTAVLDWFATLAYPEFVTGDADYLRGEITDYYGLFNEPVLIADSAGTVVFSAGLEPTDPVVRGAIDSGRRNEQLGVPSRLTPWSDDTLLLARPIGTGVHSEGVVVLEVSTARAKADITRTWTIIAVSSAVALGVVSVLAHAITRWVLRPLNSLASGVTFLTRTLPKPDAPAPLTAHYSGPPEVRNLARSFDAMAHAVLTSASAQRKLIMDTAHKLRNPLAALQLRLDALAFQLSDDVRPSVDRAGAEAERLGALLDGMLKLATVEVPEQFESAATGAADSAVCDAVLVAAERADSWSVAFAAAEITFRTEFGGDHVEVAMSESALEQILDAALSNAQRYAGPGATVILSVHSVSDMCEIAVTDDGPGVPDGELSRLTERFYRAERQGQTGTGLGLSIAHALAAAYSAALHVESAQPHGLRVKLVVGTAGTGHRENGG